MSDDDIQVTIATPTPLSFKMSTPAPIKAVLSTTPIVLQENLAGPMVQLRPAESVAFKLGIAGAGTNRLISFERTATVAGAQALTLPYVVAEGWFLLCINGLRQSVTEYSVSGNSLSLPSGLNVLIGDLISFDFYPTH